MQDHLHHLTHVSRHTTLFLYQLSHPSIQCNCNQMTACSNDVQERQTELPDSGRLPFPGDELPGGSRRSCVSAMKLLALRGFPYHEKGSKPSNSERMVLVKIMLRLGTTDTVIVRPLCHGPTPHSPLRAFSASTPGGKGAYMRKRPTRPNLRGRSKDSR